MWNQLDFVGTNVPLWAGNLFGSVFDIFRHFVDGIATTGAKG